MIEVRGAQPNDIAFIMSTFLRGLRHGNEYFEAMDSDTYYASKKEEITAVMCRPDVSVRVACASDDQELILGYAIAQILEDSANLVWVWTRPAVRLQGVAKQLCHGLNITSVGNLTKIGDDIRKKKGLQFKPVVLK